MKSLFLTLRMLAAAKDRIKHEYNNSKTFLMTFFTIYKINKIKRYVQVIDKGQ